MIYQIVINKAQLFSDYRNAPFVKGGSICQDKKLIKKQIVTSTVGHFLVDKLY